MVSLQGGLIRQVSGHSGVTFKIEMGQTHTVHLGLVNYNKGISAETHPQIRDLRKIRKAPGTITGDADIHP